MNLLSVCHNKLQNVVGTLVKIIICFSYNARPQNMLLQEDFHHDTKVKPTQECVKLGPPPPLVDHRSK